MYSRSRFAWPSLAALAALAALVASLALPGCVIVPAYRRGAFTDPAMDPMSESLTDRAMRKMHVSREAAAGGDGVSAGGGCACGN